MFKYRMLPCLLALGIAGGYGEMSCAEMIAECGAGQDRGCAIEPNLRLGWLSIGYPPEISAMVLKMADPKLTWLNDNVDESILSVASRGIAIASKASPKKRGGLLILAESTPLGDQQWRPEKVMDWTVRAINLQEIEPQELYRLLDVGDVKTPAPLDMTVDKNAAALCHFVPTLVLSAKSNVKNSGIFLLASRECPNALFGWWNDRGLVIDTVVGGIGPTTKAAIDNLNH
ncbi:hypothetical protein [Rhizobium sp. NZLR1]|uniref:hypothetical protein n=1 Tax=Rhizobium sp. NZLR1 TaxID=2731096 RepID=UPI001A97DB3D|nr:hypothetical protein [Rhizobium sp. NZLR1]MBX5201021.1 hypothetical protein [Rhizobium sp. NZLR1]QSZ21548.1 hypothetical protein J3O30_02975 [Rhizobium sp. NZLR1]